MADTKAESLLVTKAETGRILSTTVRTVDRLVRAGQLEAVRVGVRGVRITRASVDAFVAARLAGG